MGSRGPAFAVDVEVGLPLTGGPPSELAWGLYIALGVPVAAFFSAVGAEAGKDAYAATKEWLRDIFERRRPKGRGHVSLAASDGTHLRLSSELPEEALDALRDVDWAASKGGFLSWDPDRRRWEAAN